MYSDQQCKWDSCNTQYKTAKTFLLIPVTRADIAKITKKRFGPNKAHGHDLISLMIPNIYGDSERPFKSCVESRMFPSEWEKIKCSSGAQKHRLAIFKRLSPCSITPYIWTTDVPKNLWGNF